MPSSPKFFYARSAASPSHRKSTVLIFSCLIIGIVGFVLGISAFLYAGSCAHRCSNFNPTSVRVVWDNHGEGSNGISGSQDDDNNNNNNNNIKRHKVMGFVGIQTGFGSGGRRRSLRMTWMPSDHQGLQQLEEATGLAFRFIIGRTNDQSKMARGSERRVVLENHVLGSGLITGWSILRSALNAALWVPRFYVKADEVSDYLSEVITDACHGFVAGKNVLLSELILECHERGEGSSFRMFSNEDVTIGSWMLAMNVNHEDNRELCQSDCTSSFIAVWDIPKCSGLCNPEKRLLELHQQESCSKSPTMVSDD
ncbi:hypothetical protein CUMW_232170 [Citrus unshiu]|nr:hypothetical protein CUMW_232170 [Citrus unshiu]GAY64268.1 hypothetical protein CUMW_232170 [Citrus unshiu]